MFRSVSLLASPGAAFDIPQHGGKLAFCLQFGPAVLGTTEHELVARLREAFSITDDRLCATGYAQQLIARSLRGVDRRER